MSEEIEILLVRHGETDANRSGLIQGQMDSPLNSRGQAQATALIPRVQSLGPTAVYTSDLQRAYVTAEILSKPLGLTPQVEPRLRETAFGIYEGKTWDTIQRAHPKEAERWYHHFTDVGFPGGETRKAAFERAWQALEQIVKSHERGPILVVTHGGIPSLFFAHVLGIPEGVRPRCKIANTGLNILRHKNQGWTVQTWGDTSHLEGPGNESIWSL